MGRLSNRDVDDLTQMQYEDALADDEPWARESHDSRLVARGGGFPVEAGEIVYWCELCDDVAGRQCVDHQEHFRVARVLAPGDVGHAP